MSAHGYRIAWKERFCFSLFAACHPVIRNAVTSPPFSRPNWAHIDLDALAHNARVLAANAAPARLICVIKANAYGHGALPVARALNDLPFVAMLAVASVDEGAQLRAEGIEKPILLLSALLREEAEAAAKARLTPTIWTPELAAAWSDATQKVGRALPAHFKVDTGMARLGVHWCEAVARWRELQRFPDIEWRGVYTHLACADDEDDEMSAQQLERFARFLDEAEVGKNVLRHTGNSAAQLRYPMSHFDAVRPGLALYGAHPCADLCETKVELKPVMTRLARVTALRKVAAGEAVSYGATWRSPRPSRVATVACGYADGYLRALGNRGEVLIDGARFPVVGRVTMDQILVDVTDSAQDVPLGAEVILWGADLPVEEVATRAGTISYELLCAVSARVPRVYASGVSSSGN